MVDTPEVGTNRIFDAYFPRGLDRRQFLIGAAAAAGAAAVGSSFPGVASASPATGPFGGYPKFNWTTVPTVAMTSEELSVWNDEEISFLGNNMDVVALGWGHGVLQRPGNGIPPFLRDAARIKDARRPTSTLFYWSTHVHRPDLYEASRTEVRPEWIRPRPVFPDWYELGNPEFLRWWVEKAVEVAAADDVDGIFVDSPSQARLFYGPYAELQLQELRDGLDTLPGRRRLIIFNTNFKDLLDSQGRLDPLVQIADGMMCEDFYDRAGPGPTGLGRTTKPDEIKEALRRTTIMGKAGKIMLVKAWPSFNWRSEFAVNSPYEALVARARAEITFPLAAFLTAAERYSYFQYGWGWGRYPGFGLVGHGTFLYSDRDAGRVDPLWYPELLKPLGPPLHDANIDGYVLTRSFAHADVWVDLETATAEINWKKA